MMDVKLTATYFLTTDHAKSRSNQPVLFNKVTRQAYLPHETLTAYESWPKMPATEVVNRMACWRNFTSEERYFIERFLGVFRQESLPTQKKREEMNRQNASSPP